MIWKFYDKKLDYFINPRWDIDIKRKFRQTAGITLFSLALAISSLILEVYYNIQNISILEILNIFGAIYVLKLIKDKKLKFAQNFAIYFFEAQIFITAIIFSTHFTDQLSWSYALLLTTTYPAVAAIFDLNVLKHLIISVLHLIGFQILYHIFPQIFFSNIELLEQNNMLLIKALSFTYLTLFNTIIIYLMYKEQLIAKKKVLDFSNKLKLKNNKIEKLNKTKDKLFSIISHDLRSPFTSIIGFSSLLMDSDTLTDKDRRYSEIINLSSKGTLSLIDNLLYWSRSQLNSIQPNLNYHPIHEIVNLVIENLYLTALQKNIVIVNNVDENVKAFVDSNLIQIILRNLIANSIKFSNNENTIIISASNHSTNFIQVSVKDHGVGISDENIKLLFKNSFTQTGTNNEKGSGLGLFLCKEFVAIHKGIIWVESEKEKGTVVSFTIPLNNSKN